MRMMKFGPIVERRPGGTQQSRVIGLEKKKRQHDTLQHSAGLAQVLLQKVSPGKFENTPTAPAFRAGSIRANEARISR
jgi:hypothetical protein